MKQSRHAMAMLVGKYRAVIQKIWMKNLRAGNWGGLRCKQGVCAGALLISLAVSPGLAAAGEVFTYTGDGTNVRDTPSWYWYGGGWPDSLFLGNVANPLASGNTVIVNFDPNAPGVILPRDVVGGMSQYGDASGNQVIFLNGSQPNSNNDIFGGFSYYGSASGNSVTISGGTVNQCVYGGFSRTGSASGNSVAIIGGTVGDEVFGGVAAGNAAGNATGNSVTISGGTVRSDVYGGNAVTGSASGNSVTISGGTVGGNVYGGYSDSGSATSNSVTIEGNPTLTNAILYGGYVFSGSGDHRTGNTLNVKNSGMSAAGVANFQYYNFYLPVTIASGGTMLNVNSVTDISSSTIGIYVPGGATLKTGDAVNLLSSGSSSLYATNINTATSCYAGVAQIYGFSLSSNSHNLIATVSSVRQNPQVKALSEGQVSGAAMLNQGMSMLADQGLQTAREAADGASGEVATFAVLGGGSVEQDSGSHVNVNGFSLAAGTAKERKVGQDTLTSALFLEHGWGNYSTYNNFTNAASVRGDGDTHYFGAGWLEHRQNTKGQYIEGSVRLGQISNKFTSNDIGAAGTTSSYDVSTPYYGLHIGIGKETAIGENKKRDIYSKLFWTHQNGSSAIVQGDDLRFDAVDSVRSQTGIKWSYKSNESTTMRIGLAYQHEFNGKAGSTANGSAIEAPSMKGNTGILAVGLTTENKNGKGPKVDIGIQGFCGKTKGVIGTTQFLWNF